MNVAVGAQRLVALDREQIAGKVAEFAARFFHNQSARGGIPRTQLELPKTIYAATGEIAEVQSGRAAATNALTSCRERFEKSKIVVGFAAVVVGKTRGEKRFV